MKNLKRALALILAFGLLVSMTACGKDLSGSKFVGKWTATEAEYSGMTFAISEIMEEEFSFDLSANGKAVVLSEGSEANGKWDELEGGNGINLDGDYQLTEDNGRLLLEQDGIKIYFEKQ